MSGTDRCGGEAAAALLDPARRATLAQAAEMMRDAADDFDMLADSAVFEWATVDAARAGAAAVREDLAALDALGWPPRDPDERR